VTDFLLILLGVMTGMVIALVVSALVVILWRLKRPESQKPEPVKEQEPEEAPARIIDPANPPQWRVYRPQRDREAPHCNCHDRPLQNGQPVLWWPVLGSDEGEVELICEEGAGTKAPVPE
jgi:hypothetical protein